jgi:DNA (cytosine-5)-methyltransferase 1
VFGGTVAWFSEIDPAASKVLAYHYPNVPNLGDITKVAWADVPPVDVLCGGFPCQDVSAAGKRAGIKDGTRSGLWAVFAEAIDALRPRYVVIENVRGLLSATAHRAVESDDAVMGDGGRVPVLRAAGAVIGTLADLGYDAQWATVSAASVGAPHRRERVFILAADSSRRKLQRRGIGGTMAETSSRSSGTAQQRQWDGDAISGDEGDATDTPRNGWHQGRAESAGQQRGSHAAVSGGEPVDLLPPPTTQDGNGGGRYSSPGHQSTLPGEVRLLPTPRTSDTNGAGHHGDGGMDLRTTVSLLPTPKTTDLKGTDSKSDHERNSPNLSAITFHTGQWGKYTAAIQRWEMVTGTPAPAPTEPNKNGNPRLSAAFSQWLMGWPAGWVTDPAIGISRNDQLG